MATNTCQLVNIPGVAVKASFQSKVWVGGKKKDDIFDMNNSKLSYKK